MFGLAANPRVSAAAEYDAGIAPGDLLNLCLELRVREAQPCLLDRQPDHLRHEALESLRDDQPHGSERFKGSTGRLLLEDDSGALLARLGGPVDHLVLERLGGQAGFGVEYLRPDDLRNLDLVRLAVCALGWLGACEEHDRERVFALSVVALHWPFR